MIEIRYECDQGIRDTVKSNDDILIIENKSGSRTKVAVKALSDIKLLRASIPLERKFSPFDLIMTNGYQSWTETKEFADKEHLNDLRKVPLPIDMKFHFKSYGSQAFAAAGTDELIGFDFSYIKGRDPLFIGSFNAANAYLMITFMRSSHMIVLESDVSGKELNEGQSFTVFDYTILKDGKEYFDAFHPVSDRKLFGYTSWYNHYQNISEEKIDRALEGADSRFDLFQIDDGFEPYIGDWMECDKEKFPNGLSGTVKNIHDKGMLAGIWLAPLVCETESETANRHPDWIARDEKGEPIYAGSNWSGFMPLDLNNKEAVQYIRDVMRHYVRLGFDFFKLDFLYAVNLKPLKGCTRAETSEFAYQLLREELTGKLILGCGAILSNAAEKFDYCRIGPDVSLTFDDVPYMRLFHAERISTKVTICNTIFRSMLNGHFFMNDPDVFLLRDNIKLTSDQRKSLAGINALFGSLLMTSDNVSEYTEKKSIALEHALNLFHNGKVISFHREGREIRIEFELNGRPGTIIYDMIRGMIVKRSFN